MNDTIHLDLDALAPPVRKIKIGGKIVDCYPPKVVQLIRLAKVLDKIQNNEIDAMEAAGAIKEVLEPVVPAMKDDKSIDFTLPQMVALLKFTQNAAVQEAPSDIKSSQTTEEKKTVIAGQ